MKRYNFQDLILDKATDVEYYRCSEVDKEMGRFLSTVKQHLNSLGSEAALTILKNAVKYYEKIEGEQNG